MSYMYCPYCEAKQVPCHDDGAGLKEGVKHKHECSECGKTFVFETERTLNYEPDVADCLNGGEHNFNVVAPYGIDGPYFNICSLCGLEQRVENNLNNNYEESTGAQNG